MVHCYQFVGPDDKMPIRGDDGADIVSTRYLIFGEFAQIVAQVHASNINRFGGGIEELYPVVLLVVIVDVDTVVGTDFIDAYGIGFLFFQLLFGEWLIDSSE